MKRQIKFTKFVALLALAALIMLPSCYRKKDTIAIVTVMDSATNTAMTGVEVRLHYANAPVDGKRIDVRATTDSGGKVTFNFNDLYKAGQAGFAVLDIEVDSQVVGIIKVEEQKTSEKIVAI